MRFISVELSPLHTRVPCFKGEKERISMIIRYSSKFPYTTLCISAVYRKFCAIRREIAGPLWARFTAVLLHENHTVPVLLEPAFSISDDICGNASILTWYRGYRDQERRCPQVEA
ncbi:hypothetical protein CI610_03497 [invertebrate metagenome]|uniref:Uncharacterized protein n=1 Tax=invertebrate metagenome TaxID=1711999 RepID=A0A2H9T2X3_9ZZZZ